MKQLIMIAKVLKKIIQHATCGNITTDFHQNQIPSLPIFTEMENQVKKFIAWHFPYLLRNLNLNEDFLWSLLGDLLERIGISISVFAGWTPAKRWTEGIRQNRFLTAAQCGNNRPILATVQKYTGWQWVRRCLDKRAHISGVIFTYWSEQGCKWDAAIAWYGGNLVSCCVVENPYRKLGTGLYCILVASLVNWIDSWIGLILMLYVFCLHLIFWEINCLCRVPWDREIAVIGYM